MNKEEILNKYIDLIDKGYCSDCNELNCIDNFPHAKITHAIRELQQENQSLKKENKILKENAENNDKVVDKVNWENMLLKKENKQLKEQLLVSQTNEETFRLEMEDITKILGLDEGIIFYDVKIYAKRLKDNWNKLKEYLHNQIPMDKTVLTKYIKIFEVLDKMQEIEQGSDSNEKI